jgi:hypothetical protein
MRKNESKQEREIKRKLPHHNNILIEYKNENKKKKGSAKHTYIKNILGSLPVGKNASYSGMCFCVVLSGTYVPVLNYDMSPICYFWPP